MRCWNLNCSGEIPQYSPHHPAARMQIFHMWEGEMLKIILLLILSWYKWQLACLRYSFCVCVSCKDLSNRFLIAWISSKMKSTSWVVAIILITQPVLSPHPTSVCVCVKMLVQGLGTLYKIQKPWSNGEELWEIPLFTNKSMCMFPKINGTLINTWA